LFRAKGGGETPRHQNQRKMGTRGNVKGSRPWRSRGGQFTRRPEGLKRKEIRDPLGKQRKKGSETGRARGSAGNGGPGGYLPKTGGKKREIGKTTNAPQRKSVLKERRQ